MWCWYDILLVLVSGSRLIILTGIASCGGTGLFSRELSPYVKSIIGVDISPKAVEQYNSLAAEHELSGKLRAITAELKAGTHLDAPIQQFDVVLVSGFLDSVHRRSTAAPWVSARWRITTSPHRRTRRKSSRPLSDPEVRSS